VLGGLAFIALAVLGYMRASPLVIPPFVLAGGAAWVFRPRRGAAGAGQAWSWRAYLQGLPVITAVALVGYGLGFAIAVLQG